MEIHCVSKWNKVEFIAIWTSGSQSLLETLHHALLHDPGGHGSRNWMLKPSARVRSSTTLHQSLQGQFGRSLQHRHLLQAGSSMAWKSSSLDEERASNQPNPGLRCWKDCQGDNRVTTGWARCNENWCVILEQVCASVEEEGTSRIMNMHQHGVWSRYGWRGGVPFLDLGGFWHSAKHNKSQLWQSWHPTMSSAMERETPKTKIKNCPLTGHTQTMDCPGYWGLANASAATQPKRRDWKEVSTHRPSGLSIHTPHCKLSHWSFIY